MDDRSLALHVVVDTLQSLLQSRGLFRQAELLATLHVETLPPATTVQAGSGQPLRVLEHLETAGNAAGAVAGADDVPLVDAAVHLAQVAAWTQTQAYLENPPHAAFLDQYAHATLVGPKDTAAPASRGKAVGEAAVGLVLLGPDVCYPAHQHPADEVYLPMTTARWLDERTGSYIARPPGKLIHHRPGQPHGMQTAGVPLLAIYCWTGDVITPAQFC